MEEELTIYVSEKNLEEFPESDFEENSTVIVRKEHSEITTAVEKKEETQTTLKEEPPKIPSLLDLKFPEIYATRRNGRRRSGNQRTKEKKANRLGLDPDGESEDDTVDAGHGDGDGGHPDMWMEMMVEQEDLLNQRVEKDLMLEMMKPPEL